MPIEQKITTLAVAVGILLLILELVRKRRLREEYSWLWLLAGIVLLIMVSWYEGLVWISQLIGAGQTSSTVFFLGQVFMILLCLQFSVRLSRMTEQIKTLGQKLALLEARDRATPPNAAEEPGDPGPVN
jgi:hypothetical protein